MTNEVKLRKKNQTQKSNEESNKPSKSNCKDNMQCVKEIGGRNLNQSTKLPSSTTSVDLKTLLCVLSMTICIVLSRIVFQQNARFSDLEEKYKDLHGKTAIVLLREEDVLKASTMCERVQRMLDRIEGGPGVLLPQVKGLEDEVRQLKEWVTGLIEKRNHLQTSIGTLTGAVGQIEERTATITNDFNNKLASVRTDVRRMGGLQSEVQSLLSQVGELEEKSAQAERTMVKRIGDLLVGSIDRVSALRTATEHNGQAIEQLRKRIPELASANKRLSDRLRELESGRARLMRTVTFAADLKPKVFTIKKDFAAFEPQVSDLTLRIGRLAEDLTKREEDIFELRQTLVSLSAVGGDLSIVTKKLSQMTEISQPDVQESNPSPL